MQPRDFQKALGHSIDFMIPEDEKAFQKAANEGRPLVQNDTRSKAAKALHNISRVIPADPQAAGKKTKSWTRFFKRG